MTEPQDSCPQPLTDAELASIAREWPTENIRRLVSEHATHRVAREQAERERDDLARRVVANVGRAAHMRPRWAHVRDAAGVGSTRAREMCVAAGFDPEEHVGPDEDEVDEELRDCLDQAQDERDRLKTALRQAQSTIADLQREQSSGRAVHVDGQRYTPDDVRTLLLARSVLVEERDRAEGEARQAQAERAAALRMGPVVAAARHLLRTAHGNLTALQPLRKALDAYTDAALTPPPTATSEETSR